MADIAGREEVLEYFTMLLRGEIEGAKYSDSIKAAELLGKYYSLFNDKSSESGSERVIIIDDIIGGGGKV